MPDQETILPDVVDANETTHTPEYWAAVYSDLLQKMTIPEAAEKLGVDVHVLYKAVKSVQIVPFQFSSKRVYVTPRLIAEWTETHCRIPQGKPLPG